MKYHLVRIDPLRAARVAALMYFVVGLAILPVLYFVYVLAPEGIGFSTGMVLLSPFLTAGVGFASTAFGCLVYNWLAKHIEGFEIELHRHSHE
jgi:hypothetical protein